MTARTSGVDNPVDCTVATVRTPAGVAPAAVR